LQPGTNIVAAGYVMYGPSTVLVYSTGQEVNGFTLDHDLGEFLLSHENMRCPTKGHYYSSNLGRAPDWHPNIRKYVDHLNGAGYSLRYTGALVADMHRTLLEGGLYFYPPDQAHADGKLRLLYECAPLAFVAEKAGGRASTGTQRVLDVLPTTPHHRVPFVVGGTAEVELYERFLKDGH
jgi:fructose-1,6-bisphosphatase I